MGSARTSEVRGSWSEKVLEHTLPAQGRAGMQGVDGCPAACKPAGYFRTRAVSGRTERKWENGGLAVETRVTVPVRL